MSGKKASNGKRTLVVILGAIGVAVACLAILANISYAPALRDSRGNRIAKSDASIAELIAIEVNGSKQWISVRGQDKSAPVLLFLHGGPGSAEMTMTRKFFAGNLERKFVVVSWDQRGAAKSYAAGKGRTLTVDLMVDDARAVTDYLRARFGKEKIFVAGHSWGTLLGSLLVSRFPEKFAGYCAIGQLVSGSENEKISYAWALGQAKTRNDLKGIKALESIAAYGEDPRESNWMHDISVERKWLGTYGGAMGHDPSFLTAMIADIVFFSPEYTLADKVNYLRGNRESLSAMWPAILEADLRTEVPRLGVPILMVAGRYDFNTPCTLAESYYNSLTAPKKKFVWFENSAHSPCFEESAKFADEVTAFFLEGK